MNVNNGEFMKKFKLPENVIYILKTLEDNGFEGYIVGGCVRDLLLDKNPNDWDITTNALPVQLFEIFPKSVDIGANHGTVGVIFGSNDIVEVTTYRIDGDYTDNRRPDSVIFTPNLSADLARRDFTINAMAYNENGGLVDLYDGIDDLRRGIIRCVGDANLRFREDALRMLRAVRFAAQLGFEIEPKTYDAICVNAQLIKNISAERICAELDKILLSDNPQHLKTIVNTGLGEFVFPEFSTCFATPQNTKYHIYNVGEHTLLAVENTPKQLNVRLAALLHDWGKPASRTTDEDGVDHFYGHGEVSVELARNFLNRLKYSNEIKDTVLPLVKYHDTQINPDKNAVKRAINKLQKHSEKVDDTLFLDLLDLKLADTLAQNPEYSGERQKLATELRGIYFEIKENQEALKIANLAINGRDLMNLGVPEGKEIGEILKKLLDAVIENPKLNTKEKLLEQARLL